MSEPQLLSVTLRDTSDVYGVPGIDLECRFADGQKFAAIEVDGEFPELARRIADFLNANAPSNARGKRRKDRVAGFASA